jgi:hypothetical protein
MGEAVARRAGHVGGFERGCPDAGRSHPSSDAGVRRTRVDIEERRRLS